MGTRLFVLDIYWFFRSALGVLSIGQFVNYEIGGTYFFTFCLLLALWAILVPGLFCVLKLFPPSFSSELKFGD